MKFDPRKPHGTITNHAWARYEQNGVLFNSVGESPYEPEEEVEKEIKEEIKEEPPEVESKPAPDPFGVRNAKDFLKNILAEGPLPRSSIYKESQANNQDWDNVKTAFAQMDGEKVMRKTVTYWKLKTE